MGKKKTVEIESTGVATDKVAEPTAKGAFVRGIIGIALLLVFGSIAFSTVVIWTGTDNLTYKVLTAPAAIFDLLIAFVAFSKILK